MARRPSSASVVSLVSSRAPLEPIRSPNAPSVSIPSANRLPSVIPQSASLAPSRSQHDAADTGPDELFAKYTIPEVKAKQAQLRADAEARQEDLRIMVGERYRDLLQASSSIISIAASAHRVQEALEEATSAIRSQRIPVAQNHISQSGKGDSHLQMLQVLSAHIKLLLDAPEHLWRLIEREKYFQAAWLFLLARVVHRALIRDDAHDDESWVQHGIDVLEQFPLIQRQWEAVSHIRTQIIHKATLSLRLYDKTYEETCATLLTLHILDSRPLSETLTIYLSQRTRTLNVLLSKTLDIPEKLTNGFSMNGGPLETHKITRREKELSAKNTAMATKKLARTTLEAISWTVNTARAVFGTPAAACSLAVSVLDSIQSDSLSASSTDLPAELTLNTQAVLSSLPSSTYVSLLPANIQAYRPFVDLSSISSSLPQEMLQDKLKAWFVQSVSSLHGSLDTWLASLDVVSVVWRVRSSLRKWVVHSGLEASEIVSLTEPLDEVFGSRIACIWKTVLVHAEEEFLRKLGSLGLDEEGIFSPLCNLYGSPSVIVPQHGPSPIDPNFHTYKESLAQRLEGRAPRLHEILCSLEDAAALLQRDLSRMCAEGEDSRKLVVGLSRACHPGAQALCTRIGSALGVSSEELMASPDSSAGMNKLVFHAHLAKELSLSPFLPNIGCDQSVANVFRDEMKAMFERIMSSWEERVVAKLVSYYVSNAEIWPARPDPSPPMMECLYSLSSSIHNLGMSHHGMYLMTIPKRIISKFSAALARNIDGGASLHKLHVLYDLSFLRHIAYTWKNVEIIALEQTIARLHLSLADSREHDPDRRVLECLARTQMLISGLLPPISEAAEVEFKEPGSKMAGILAYGVPVVDSHFVPAVELAPPSSRFPLLLVDAR